MRIAVLVDAALPQWGGSHTFQHGILDALEKHAGGRGHEFVVIGPWSVPPVQNAGHLQYVGFLGSRMLSLKAKYWKIRDIARRVERPLPHFKHTNLAEYYARKYRANFVWHLSPNYGAVDLPFIYTVWDLEHRTHPWFPEVSTQGQWIERDRQYSAVLPRASAVITGTEVGKNEIASYYNVPRDHIRVVPFPAPPEGKISEEFARSVMAKYQLPENFLFYPAQFWPHKNHVGLLLAAKVLRDVHGITVPIVLVGSDSSVRRYAESFIEQHGLGKQIHVLGFVPVADRDALYTKALALVMATHTGPDNFPPLEAFSLGCPVVASRVTGAEEQLGDAALLVDSCDEYDMALGIKRVYEDAALRQMLIERGYVRARSWTGRDYVERVLSIFDDLGPYLRCWIPSIDLPRDR